MKKYCMAFLPYLRLRRHLYMRLRFRSGKLQGRQRRLRLRGVLPQPAPAPAVQPWVSRWRQPVAVMAQYRNPRPPRRPAPSNTGCFNHNHTSVWLFRLRRRVVKRPAIIMIACSCRRAQPPLKGWGIRCGTACLVRLASILLMTISRTCLMPASTCS